MTKYDLSCHETVQLIMTTTVTSSPADVNTVSSQLCLLLPCCMECRRSLAMRILSPSVRPSVRPSVTRVNCNKMVERFVQIFIPYERAFILVF